MTLTLTARPLKPLTAEPPPDRGRAWLSRLFAGDLTLATVEPASVPPADRSAAEHDTVARALGCPDLFVIAAADTPARERCIADLARAAAARGERVLVLSPDPAAADRLVGRVADGGVLAVRALATAENLHRLPAAVARLTSAAIGDGRVEQLRREAGEAVAALEGRVARLAAAADALEKLRGVTARRDELESEQAALIARLAQLDAEVRAEADGPAPTPFAERVRAHRTVAGLDGLAAEAEEAARAAAEKVAALEAARLHLTEHAGEKKPGFFARLLGKKTTPDPVEEQQLHDLERETRELADREARLRAGLEAAAARLAPELDRLVAGEVADRRAAAEARLAAIGAELDQHAAAFRDHAPAVEAAGRPVTFDTESVRQAAVAVQAERAAVEEQLAAARDRLDGLTRPGPEAAHRLLAEVPVVVGTPGSLDADPVFAAVHRTDGPPFDRIILDRAEELTEPDFVRLARLADRWVLAGEVFGPFHRPPRNGRPPEPTLLARLARLLDRDPWTAEGDRLVGRLVPLSPDRRRGMTREPLLDRPEVELRFIADEAGEPLLAEIAFPAGTAAADARAFVAREVGQPLLRPCGEPHRHQTADQITVCWPAADVGEGVWVELAPGVREKVTGAGPAAFTAAVSFDIAAGWDTERAEAWLAEHLPAASAGRVATLPRSSLPHPTPSRPVAVG